MKIPMKIPGKTVATEINQTNPGNKLEQAISLLLAALGFQSQGCGSLACMLRRLHAIESLYSRLVRHLLTSWRLPQLWTSGKVSSFSKLYLVTQ